MPLSHRSPLTRAHSATASAALVMLLCGACARDEVTGPLDTPASFHSVVAHHVQQWRPLRDTLFPLNVDLPSKPRPWDAGPDALKAAVASVNGRVAIGLKPPRAMRTMQSGIVPGISRRTFENGVGELVGKGVVVLETYRNFPSVVAAIDPESVPELLALSSVDYIEPLIPMLAASQDTSWGTERIRAPLAWSVGARGSGANIWILDSGVDSTHATASTGDWNTYNAMCGWSTGHFDDCYDDALDDLGHGTLVHSVAVAENNDVGFIGVAHGVSGNTMIRVCEAIEQGEGYFIGCYVDAAAAAIDSAISTDDPRTIINMSFGGAQTQFLATAVASAWNAGILLVASAGNNDVPSEGIQYPASDNGVIAVTGTTETDGFAGEGVYECGYSNDGSEAELSAPFRQSGMRYLGRYQDNTCGTSFAAPAVAGVAALVWGKYPTWTAAQVRSRLTATANDLGASGRDVQFGYGRVDACEAVDCQVEFTLDGSDELEVDEDGTWWVSGIVGGAGPYSYRWYKDNVLQTGQTGSSFTTSFPTEGWWHTVGAEVIPTGGLPGSDYMYVNVKSCEGEEECEG